MANLLQKAAQRVLGLQSSAKGLMSGLLMGGILGDSDIWGGKEIDFYKYQLAYKQVSWVFSCASIIATNLAMTRRYVLDKANKEITQGPLIDLMNQPNPDESWFEFIEGYALDKLLTGNSYWLKDQLNLLKTPQPKYLYRLDPKRVIVAVNRETGKKTGYVYELNNRRIPLDLEEVIHIKSANPLSPHYGMGVVEAAMLALETDLYSTKINLKFFKNGARLSGALSTDKTLSDETFKRVKEQFSEEYAGEKNAYKIPIIEGGLKYDPFSLSPKDMDFKELRKFSRDEICSMFKVPPPKIGIMEYANYKMEEADKTFNKECLSPELIKLQGVWLKIAQLYDLGHRVEFDKVYKDDTAFDQMLKANGATNNASFSANDFREYLGWEKTTWGDAPFISFGMVPAGQDQAAIDNAPVKAIKDLGQSNTDIKRVARSMITKIDRAKMSVADKFKTKLKVFFNKQEERVINKVLDTAREDLDIDKIFNTKKEDKEIAKASLPHFAEAVKLGATIAEQFVSGGKGLRVKAMPQAKIDMIAASLAEKIKRIHDTTKEEIRAVIKEGIEQDLHVNEIAYGNTETGYKGIQGVFDKASDYRAELIARTETVNAYSESSVATYKELGVEKKSWMTAGDDKVRPEHQANEEEGPIGVDEEFQDGEMWPGEPNCRCQILPFIERT